MRNNLERMGLDAPTPQQDGDPVPQINQGKSEISYIQPTELVELPSGGRFYSADHPLHKVSDVEIRYMTTKDEEILNSKSLLQKGVALDKMIQGLLLDNRIKIGSLLIGDKNAIVLAARITGYDAEYKTQVICTSCGEKTTQEFNLNEIKPRPIPEDVTISDEGYFDLTLPYSKAVVTCKMMTGDDETALRMQAEKKKKHKLPESPIVDQLVQLIIAVNDDTDKEVVSKFVKELLAKDSQFLRKEYARIAPNLDLSQQIECENCHAESTITIPFTVDFFWPNR